MKPHTRKDGTGRAFTGCFTVLKFCWGLALARLPNESRHTSIAANFRSSGETTLLAPLAEEDVPGLGHGDVNLVNKSLPTQHIPDAQCTNGLKRILNVHGILNVRVHPLKKVSVA